MRKLIRCLLIPIVLWQLQMQGALAAEEKKAKGPSFAEVFRDKLPLDHEVEIGPGTKFILKVLLENYGRIFNYLRSAYSPDNISSVSVQFAKKDLENM